MLLQITYLSVYPNLLMYHKLDEIRTYLHSFYPFNVYCCCETFLNNTISDQDIVIEGYNIVRRDGTQCGGGGGFWFT